MLLRSAWYIGAWADELGDKPLARRICGDPVVLFRDGQIVRLELHWDRDEARRSAQELATRRATRR